jgi:hypothetical protein
MNRGLLPIEGKESILRRQDWRWGPSLGKPSSRVFTDSPLSGADVDERRHVGVIAGLCDHRSPIGMTDEDDRLALCVDDVPGRFGITFELFGPREGSSHAAPEGDHASEMAAVGRTRTADEGDRDRLDLFVFPLAAAAR